MTSAHTQTSRRNIVMGAGALAAAHASPASAANARRPYDLTDPADNLEVYVKLRGNLDGAETYSWSCGQAYGSRPGKIAELLFDVQTCLRSRWIRTEGRSFKFQYRGMIIFLEPGTTRHLEKWTNPLTSDVLTPVHYHTSLAELDYTPAGIRGGVLKLAEASSAMKKQVFMQPTTVVGDDLWMLGDERMIYSRPSDGAIRVDNLINRYHGKLSEIENRALPSAACDTTWTAELNWFPWMKLDAVEGHLFWGGMGRKFQKQSELPKSLLESAERLWPGAFTQPLGS